MGFSQLSRFYTTISFNKRAGSSSLKSITSRALAALTSSGSLDCQGGCIALLCRHHGFSASNSFPVRSTVTVCAVGAQILALATIPVSL